ncbi:MAG TPA: hypothetical protein VKI19_12680 [Acidimicrobiales bacterium]|nr:hypothetical protein [Acidimicrobiales bacterium]
MSVATGLFVPELALGLDVVDTALRRRLQRYLHDVLEARKFPLHTTVAWNALHFGFDPDSGSYDETLLDAAMSTIELGGRTPALPVGALAWVHLGGSRGDVWAEIVGKDGRPSGVESDGTAPLRLAGRPADREEAIWQPAPGGSTDQTRTAHIAVVSEALICDFEAFGHLPDLGAALTRLERKGRLGPHRLIEVEAVYDPPEAAEDSDTWFYARWLFDTQRHLLAAGPLGTGLVDRSEDALRAALVGSLSTVDLLLSSIPGVVRWGDYALLAEWVAEIDWSPNLPLHRADIEWLITSMAGVPGGGEGATVTALAPRLGTFIKAPEPATGRPDEAAVDPLAGLDYLRVLTRTGRWLADRLDDAGGVVTVRGERRLLRVDDTWPWGGLWRSEPWGPGHPLTGVPADEPLRIGWRGWEPLAEYLGMPLAEVVAAVEAALTPSAVGIDEEPRGAEEPAAAANADDEGTDDEDSDDGDERPDDDVAATLIEGHATLRQVDVDTGTLPLAERFGWLADGNPVSILLSHQGDIDDDQISQNAKAAGAARLEGLDWPVDFFGGIRMHVSAISGGRVLFAATLPLPDIGDSPFAFAFDPGVVGRPSGDVELTLAAVAVAALRRHGRTASDGTRRATAAEISGFCFGPARPAALIDAVAGALDVVVAAGRLAVIGTEYTWSPSLRPAPRRSAPTGWVTTRLRRDEVRVHMVPAVLRHLHPGWNASPGQLALYSKDRTAGLVFGPETLPPGVTYVPTYRRGSRDSVITETLRQVVSALDGQPPASDELQELFEEWDT